jgi:hypothetical protein
MTQAFNLSQLANRVNSSGQLNASSGLYNTASVSNGGTGASTATNAKINLEVITAATGSEILPVGTTAQRDGSPQTGYLRFNTDTDTFEGYDGTQWGQVGGGATGNGGDQIFVLNGQVVYHSYTVPSSQNASSAGPITVDTGVTVTVSTGSRWVIV